MSQQRARYLILFALCPLLVWFKCDNISSLYLLCCACIVVSTLWCIHWWGWIKHSSNCEREFKEYHLIPLPLVIQICSYPALSKECIQWDFSFSLNTIKFLIPSWWELYKLPNLLPQSKYLISLLSALHFINF